jgi:branched-chain amino acid transport system permease protein
MEEYIFHLLLVFCINALIAQSFNVFFGLMGLLNLAHYTLVAIGAYTVALLSTNNLVLSPLLLVTLAILCSAFFGIIIYFFSEKTNSSEFCLVTLTIALLIQAILFGFTDITNGPMGISNIERNKLIGVSLASTQNFLIFVALFTLIGLTILFLVFKSPVRRTLISYIDLPHVSFTLGVNSKLARLLSVLLASAVAGLAGALLCLDVSYVDPYMFSLAEIALVLLIVFLGKPGSFWGALLSTAFITVLPELIRLIKIPTSLVGQVNQLIYCSIILICLYFLKNTWHKPSRNM